MNAVSFTVPKHINKVCSCGQVYEQIPENYRAWIDEGQLLGWVWECSCQSTLFVPSFNLKKAKDEKDFATQVTEFFSTIYKKVL